MNTESFQKIDAEAQQEGQPLLGKVSVSSWTGTKVMLIAIVICIATTGVGFYVHHRHSIGAGGVKSGPLPTPVLLKNPIATIQTSMGEMQAEIFLKEMPITASNFIDLCKSGFYDGTRFHRVIPNFMVQLGDPNSRDMDRQELWGMGGPKPYTKFSLLDPSGQTLKTLTRSASGSIEDEFAAKISNDVGTLAMANAGPQSGGSQFFINVVHNKYLDWFDDSSPSKHPVFGKVTDVRLAKAISEVQTESDRPVAPIEIQSCKLTGV